VLYRLGDTLHLNTVDAWIKTGRLAAVKLGPRRVRITGEVLAAFMRGETGTASGEDEN
jgi:excisionase family DNA binding protein